MAYLQQPSNQSITFDDNQDPSKNKQPLPPIITQQSSLSNIPPFKKVNISNGLHGGGACFDCLACICCCCALEECCGDCCQDL